VLSRLEQVGSAAGSRVSEVRAGPSARGRASWGGDVRVHTTKDSPDARIGGEREGDGGEDSPHAHRSRERRRWGERTHRIGAVRHVSEQVGRPVRGRRRRALGHGG